MALSQPSIHGAQRSEISSLKIFVDGGLSEGDISSQMMTKQTPWSPLIFLNETLTKNLGAPREYYDPLIFYNDVLHLTSYLHDRGYFAAQIDTSLSFREDDKYVDITLKVISNHRSLIDSFTVLGVQEFENKQSDIFRSSLIKVGIPFDKNLLINEQDQLLRSLKSSGYPQAKLDSVSIKRFASTGNIFVLLRFNTGKRFTFGEVFLPEEETQVEPEVILRQLDFAQGDIYDEEKRISSEQNLNRLGLFENASVRPVFAHDSVGSTSVPVHISLRSQELQEITPEILVLNENNTFLSTGLGLGYKHRNFFGGAKNFSITARGRLNYVDQYVQYLFSSSKQKPTLYSKADIQSQLIFPYFYSNKTSASITLSAEKDQQVDYTLTTLRAKVGFVTRLATYTVGSTDFNIERVDPAYRTVQSLRVEDTTKQFNFIESFTLQRDKTNNIFSPTSGFFHSGTIEEAGLISHTAGGFGLPYSEYYKFSFLLKHYFAVSSFESQIIALKLRGGFAQLYNSKNTTPVPLPRRFFAGGSGSVRGWKDKQLSAFGNDIVGGNFAVEGSIEDRLQLFPNKGKFLFMNLENIWSVLFLDYGNTWNTYADAKLNDVALAVGFGLRYETFVGPFRFDLAWRLYDPKKPQGQQWLYEQQFFVNSFSLVQFGIGHAF
ncbi:MAG: BamA/TamA family outer membrane protein [Bacteroidota bacterium]|nr:BamA/TamA family outer membrane protein [Bacteroidota bacterium]